MNDEQLDALEAELRGLRPRRPSELLAARVSAALDGPRSRSRRWWPALSLAAAAGVALALILAPRSSREGGPEEAARVGTVQEPGGVPSGAQTGLAQPGSATPGPAAPANALQRIGEVGFLYAAQDEGLVLAPDATPFRRIRFRVLDTREYRDPVEQAVIRVAVPREDVLFVPTEVY